MRQTKTTLYLEVTLTEEELRLASKAMADAFQKRAQAEIKLDSFKKQVNADIASYEATFAKNSVLINSGKEYRSVPCKIEYDFIAKKKFYLRTDTLETVKDDIITEEELQEEIKLQDEKEGGREGGRQCRRSKLICS